MKLQTAILCNAATQESTGLVNILGAFIDNMGGPQYPIRGQVWLVARLHIEESDFDQQHAWAVTVMREDDGEQVARVDGAALTQRPPTVDPDMPIGTNLVLPLPLEFRRGGLHRVALIIDGETLWSSRLTVHAQFPAIQAAAVPIYTDHAGESMELRQVEERDVEAVLNAPIGKPAPGNQPDTLVITGFRTSGLPLRVVVDAADTTRVVTVLT